MERGCGTKLMQGYVGVQRVEDPGRLEDAKAAQAEAVCVMRVQCFVRNERRQTCNPHDVPF